MATLDYIFHFPILTVRKMTIVDSKQLCDDVAEGRKENVKFQMPLWTLHLLQTSETSSKDFDAVWQQAVGPDVLIDEAVKIEKSSTGFIGYFTQDIMERAVRHRLKKCLSYMYETSVPIIEDSTDSDSVTEGKGSEPSHGLPEVEHRKFADGETNTLDSE